MGPLTRSHAVGRSGEAEKQTTNTLSKARSRKKKEEAIDASEPEKKKLKTSTSHAQPHAKNIDEGSAKKKKGRQKKAKEEEPVDTSESQERLRKLTIKVKEIMLPEVDKKVLAMPKGGKKAQTTKAERVLKEKTQNVMEEEILGTKDNKKMEESTPKAVTRKQITKPKRVSREKTLNGIKEMQTKKDDKKVEEATPKAASKKKAERTLKEKMPNLMASTPKDVKKRQTTKAERVHKEEAANVNNDDNNNNFSLQIKEKQIEEHNNSDVENVLEQLSQNSAKHRAELLQALNAELGADAGRGRSEEMDMSYSLDELRQFVAQSSICRHFTFVHQLEGTTQLLQRFIDIVYQLDSVQLDELLDLYHVSIMMFAFRQEAHCIGQRFELLQAVAELAASLQPEQISYIGMNLCERFVMGAGVERMRRIIDLHCALLALARNDEINCKIAMITLLATFSKVAEVPLPRGETDIIQAAFAMAKLVDWKQLIVSGRETDVFVLVRSFGLIINTRSNRLPHANWDQQLGSEIHRFFMTVLATVRCCRDYGFFHMMLERFIAFCVVRGATARAHTLDMLEGSNNRA